VVSGCVRPVLLSVAGSIEPRSNGRPETASTLALTSGTLVRFNDEQSATNLPLFHEHWHSAAPAGRMQLVAISIRPEPGLSQQQFRHAATSSPSSTGGPQPPEPTPTRRRLLRCMLVLLLALISLVAGSGTSCGRRLGCGALAAALLRRLISATSFGRLTKFACGAWMGRTGERRVPSTGDATACCWPRSLVQCALCKFWGANQRPCRVAVVGVVVSSGQLCRTIALSHTTLSL
jgi:hypothetical protein